MEEVNNPTDRHVIWVIGEEGNEGKTWFQKYIKSTFGARRVVSGINLMTKSGSICHALTKYPLATTDIFLFNIARSKRAFEEINYKILEDLKDGDAFADKYDSQLLKIKSPNVVMVFSNDMPEHCKMSVDRWRVFYIENDELLTEEDVELDSPTTVHNAFSKGKKSTKAEKFAKGKKSYSYDSDDGY